MSDRTPPTESELVELVHSIDERAPEHLHRRIDALIAERTSAPRGRRAPLRLGLAGALTLGVIAVALAVSLAGGGSS